MCFTDSKSVNAVYILSVLLLLVSLMLLPFGKVQYSAIVCSVVILILIITLTVVGEQEQKTECAITTIARASEFREVTPPSWARENEQSNGYDHDAAPVLNDVDNMQSLRNRANFRNNSTPNYIHNYNPNMMHAPETFAAQVPGNIFNLPISNGLPTCDRGPDVRMRVRGPSDMSAQTRGGGSLCSDDTNGVRHRLTLPLQMESTGPTDPLVCDGVSFSIDDTPQCGSGFTVVPPVEKSCGCGKMSGECTCGCKNQGEDQKFTKTGHKIVPNLPPFPGVAQYTGESVWRLPEWPADQPSREECIAAVVSDLPTCGQQTPKEVIRNQGLYGIKGNVSCDLLKRSAVADTGFLQPLGARNAFLAYNSYDQLHAKDQFMIANNKQVF